MSAEKRDLPIAGRTIIYVAQGETGRLNCYTTPNTDLMTARVKGCCAVIFMDNKGNVSLTHLDPMNSFYFMQVEAKKMEGEYTIDFMDRLGAETNVSPALIKYKKKHFPCVQNSEGHKKVRITETGIVLVRPEEGKNSVLIPTQLEVVQLFPKNAKKRALEGLPVDNRFRKDHLQVGEKTVEARTLEKLLMLGFSGSKKMHPTLVFDNEWTGQFPESNRRVIEIMAEAKEIYHAPDRHFELTQFFSDLFGDLNREYVLVAVQCFEEYMQSISAEKLPIPVIPNAQSNRSAFFNAGALNTQGIVAYKAGDYVGAISCFTRVVQHHRRLGDSNQAALLHVLYNLGSSHHKAGPGHCESAHLFLEEAFFLAQNISKATGIPIHPKYEERYNESVVRQMTGTSTELEKAYISAIESHTR
jgi:hypothetical protein